MSAGEISGTSAGDNCEAFEGEGFDIGQISMDWSLQDGEGNTFHLSDYCGQAIFIEDTAGW